MSFDFKTKVWVYPGMAGWHFVSVPVGVTKKIDKIYSDFKRGFGSLKVMVTVGETSWKTSIFPDKKTGTYLLPLKAQVRKKENIKSKQVIELAIKLLAD